VKGLRVAMQLMYMRAVMRIISRMRSASGALEIAIGTGMISNCLCSHEAVLWIFDVLVCVSGEVMDKVRYRTSSRISAAAVLRFRDSRVCL
jgi:hypothetical protein